MYIRRRNYEHGRIKRNNRRNKSNESLHFIFGTYFKLLLAWASIIMLDFFTDLRFEFIWSCWLMMRTVNDSFRYQGLAFALFFTLTAIMADLLCYFLVPTTFIYLLGSSCVWIHLLWQTDRGVYIPTVALCFLFFYVEVAVRFRDPKNLPFGIDLCRPFAAHCIGYPVVTLGFSLKSMISHHFRLKRQKFVEAQNITFFSILEQALPKELWCYLKSDTIPKSKHSNMVCENNCSTLAISSTSAVPGLTSTGHITELNSVNMIHSKDKENHSSLLVNRKNISQNHSRTTRIISSSTRGDNCTDLSLCSNDDSASHDYTFSLDSDEQMANPTFSASLSLSEQPESYVSVSLAQTIFVKVPPVSSPSVSDSVSSEDQAEICIRKDTDIKENKVISKKSTSTLVSTTSSLTTSTCSNSTTIKSYVSPGVNNSTNNNKTKSICTSSNTKSSEAKQSSASVNNTSAKTTFTASNSSGTTSDGKSNPSGSTSLSTGCKSGGKSANKDEYTLKLEAEARHLKSEIQSLRSSEIQLRSQVQQLLAAERTYRSESSQAQQESESLQAKLNQLTQRLQADRASLQAAEKRLVEERKHRLLLEEQFKQQSGKQIESGFIESASKEQVTSKSTDSKASMTESRSTPYTSYGPICVEACKNNELCSKRRQDLELELKNLTKALALKDNQLTSLNAERFSHSGLNESTDRGLKKQTKVERTKQSNPSTLEQHYSMSTRRQKHEITETELNDLASRVNSLQEENQRLTDTLKEEDKMKQELMTAYHSSLKEITELNATLTKKEYQIVELNKRLNCLTPNLCEYVSRMNASTSNYVKSSNVSIPLQDISNEESGITSYSVLDTSHSYADFNKTQTDEFNHHDRSISNSASSNRMNSYNQSYCVTAYETSAPLNNVSNQKSSIYFADPCVKEKSFFTSPFSLTDKKVPGISEMNDSVNPNTLNYFGHLSSSDGVVPSSSLTNSGLGYHTNFNDNCHMNNRMHFRPNKVPNSTAFHLDHFETVGLKCVKEEYTSYDNTILNRILPASSVTLCSTRPLPIGSSAPASSPLPLFVSPPSLLQGDVASNIFHYSHSINGTLSIPSVEGVANSSICATESMSTTPTAVGSFSPRIIAGSYSTDQMHTVGHHEELSSQPHNNLDFNSSMCGNTSNNNSHSILMTSNASNCFQFGMRNSSGDKSNCFDFTTFGSVGSPSPAGAVIHSHLISSNCGSSVLSNLTSAGLKSRQVCLDSQNTEILRFSMMSPSVSYSDATSHL
ncbi:hypothetical protein MN116_001188 [Schistosoma mekongi]|uniref:Macoilin n=1 Tax=Schistosoma mekongi TaxID=38744 RepID=A0AAE1ZM38_SCHME|nr:hypothetical protein MN116_001188 [Schistosoma mekongi]